MGLTTEAVYLGKDNKIGLTLNVDGSAMADHTVITRAVLEFGAPTNLLAASSYLTIDSDSAPTAFDFTDATKLILILGDQTIPRGRHNVTVTVYTPTYSGGLSFDTDLELRVQ